MPEPKPLHLAIIPDGNRRWARERKMMPWRGHQKSAENFDSLIKWCMKDKRVETLTFWCFSTENWKRDPREVKKLMELLEKYLRKERANLKKNRIHLVHSGRTDRLNPSIAGLLEEISRETAKDPVFTLHLALDYGGKDEITRAFNRLLDRNVDAATEDDVRSCLDHPDLPDIDLIIRTSGERRTSNFFLWQSAYAEWVFLEKHFPDVTEDDLCAAIDDFNNRQRRFGK